MTDPPNSPSHHLIGSLKLLGITLPSSKRHFQRSSLVLPTLFNSTTKSGTDGISLLSHLHQNHLNYQVNGRPNAKLKC